MLFFTVFTVTHLRELKRCFIHKLFLRPDSGPRPDLPVNQSEHRNTVYLLQVTWWRKWTGKTDTCSPELQPRWQSGKKAWAPEVKQTLFYWYAGCSSNSLINQQASTSWFKKWHHTSSSINRRRKANWPAVWICTRCGCCPAGQLPVRLSLHSSQPPGL